jgi:cellulose synthase/poly-beta-1,6-N-acetylglucosamine synthase-like glycosyltransferase
MAELTVSSPPRRRRHQLGTDHRQQPLPAIPRRPSESAISVGRLAIVVTVAGWACFAVVTVERDVLHGAGATAGSVAEAIGYLLLITFLTGSALAYLITRLGYFHRALAHRRAPRAEIDEFFDRSMPTITVTVPSYREDKRVVRRTLLSAALQEYPCLRIALLIDDPPYPTEPHLQQMLTDMRALVGEVTALLAEPSASLEAALEMFESRVSIDEDLGPEDIEELARHHDYAVAWLSALADEQGIIDHADTFFAEHVVRALAKDVALRAAALRGAVRHGGTIENSRLLQLSRRLAWTFRAELSSFERKRYRSLSHEPSKAMNLNSYIGLMGGCYREIVTPFGADIAPVTSGTSDFEVPNPDFVLNLDADSVLLPEYCERIVHLLEQSQHERVAVGQTPYSSYPAAATRIERIAGATTDVQHLLHQGLTYYEATFWVGANAIVRKRALDDIVKIDYVGDVEVRRYISDRTVIEDTDASIDLGVAGWTLINYPERLSYSSTPPDFGSLAVQRQRWANGGLLIVHKLHQQARHRSNRGERMRIAEWFLRLNYMASICWTSVGLVLLLAYPFNNRLLSVFTVFAALPYFVMMSSDLKMCGYNRRDVLWIYGFNLLLAAVNLAGVLSSVWQWLTGEKAAFGRTPKVRDRTRASLLFAFAPYAIVVLSLLTFVSAYKGHRWGSVIYAGLNTVLCLYAIVALMGLRYSLSDIWAGLVRPLYKIERPAVADQPPPLPGTDMPPPLDWQSVLYHGTDDPTYQSATRPSAARSAAAAPAPAPTPAPAAPRRGPGPLTLPPTESGGSPEPPLPPALTIHL